MPNGSRSILLQHKDFVRQIMFIDNIISRRGVAYEETGKNTGKNYLSLEKIENVEDILADIDQALG